MAEESYNMRTGAGYDGTGPFHYEAGVSGIKCRGQVEITNSNINANYYQCEECGAQFTHSKVD
jgi:hypothetical protein